MCEPEYFAAGHLFAQGEYATKSETAHSVIGLCLFGVTMTWGFHIVRWPQALARPCRAYLLAGAFCSSAGAYLLLWVLLLLQPARPAALFRFARRDLVQLQHLGIALSLVDVLTVPRYSSTIV